MVNHVSYTVERPLSRLIGTQPRPDTRITWLIGQILFSSQIIFFYLKIELKLNFNFEFELN